MSVTDVLGAVQTVQSLSCDKSLKADDSDSGLFMSAIEQCLCETNVETDNDSEKNSQDILNLAAALMGSTYFPSFNMTEQNVSDSENMSGVAAEESVIVDVIGTTGGLSSDFEAVQKILDMVSADSGDMDSEAAGVMELTEQIDSQNVDILELLSEKGDAQEPFAGMLGLDSNEIGEIQTILESISENTEINTDDVSLNMDETVGVQQNIAEDSAVLADSVTNVEQAADSDLGVIAADAETGISVDSEKSISADSEASVDEITADDELSVNSTEQTAADDDTGEFGSDRQSSDDGLSENSDIQYQYNINQESVGDINTRVSTFEVKNVDNPAGETVKAVSDILVKSTFLTENDGSKQMEIQLQPESLGKIIIKLESTDGVMNIKITASQHEVKDALLHEVAQLQTTLKDQGVQVNNIEVSSQQQQSPQDYSGNGENNHQEQQSKQNRQNTKDVDYNEFLSALEEVEGILQGINNNSNS